LDIPVIDISGFAEGGAKRDRVVREWAAAFETIGFAQIVGHGVPPGIADDLDRAARAFFALPVEEKLKSRVPQGGIGYTPSASVTLGRFMESDAKPDLVEAMGINDLLWDPSGRRAQFATAAAEIDIWPATLPEFRTAVEAYVRATFDVAQQLMRISALALDLPEDHFARFFDRMGHGLRLAYYPRQPDPPGPGQLRSGPHTDFSGFTLLRQDVSTSGLQVLGPDGGWIPVAPVRGAYVINAGDLLQRWTNDRWKSNIHRVINPPRAIASTSDRLSIVLFTGPNPDAVVECLPTCTRAGEAPLYPPIVAAEHSAERLRQAIAAPR
jgi:isopenicillin N synthase-like dioxygenase